MRPGVKFQVTTYTGEVLGTNFHCTVNASNTQDARYEVARQYRDRYPYEHLRVVDILPHVSVRRFRGGLR